MPSQTKDFMTEVFIIDNKQIHHSFLGDHPSGKSQAPKGNPPS